MEEDKGLVKHILLAKFKDEVTAERIDELIRGYASLVSIIEPMKAFHWGRDVSIEGMHQGFTHVFESSIEGTQGLAEYVKHPVHVRYSAEFLKELDKCIVVDYNPTPVINL